MYAQAASSGVLLDYAVSTDPAPLVASPSTAGASPATGSITLVASNGSTDQTIYYLQSLTISLAIGPSAQDLTNDGSAIVATVLNGSGSPWAEPTVVSNAGPYVIEIEALDGQPVAMTAEALVVELSSISMNTEPGVAVLTVTELASATSDTWETGAYESNIWTQAIGKFPYDFYMTNFAPSAPMVANGGSVTLTWDASQDAVYTLTYGDAKPVDVTDVRRYTASGLTVDTTFLLCGKAAGGSTYLSTTVTVANPDVSATTLTVLGGSTLGGDVAVGSLDAPAILAVFGDASVVSELDVGGALTVGQPASLSGLDVTGPTTLDTAIVAHLDVTGSLDVGSSGAPASLNVAGSTTLAALGVTGAATLSALTVGSSLSAGNSSAVSMMKGGVSLLSGSDVPTGTVSWAGIAPTDGFVVGWIGSGNSGQLSGGDLILVANGASAWTSGSSVVSLYDQALYSRQSTGSACLPVAANSQITVIIALDDDNTWNPTYHVFFVPLGNSDPFPTGSTNVTDESVGEVLKRLGAESAGINGDAFAALLRRTERPSAPRRDAAAIGAVTEAIARCLPDGVAPDRLAALDEALKAVLRPSGGA